jgi:hypothetical protein
MFILIIYFVNYLCLIISFFINLIFFIDLNHIKNIGLII